MPGVYLNARRDSALLFRVDDGTAYYVANVDGKFDVHSAPIATFGRTYTLHLPDYPMRRCARVYGDSLFTRTPNAQRVINHYLRT